MNSLKEAKLNFAKCVQAVLTLSASIFTAFAFLKTPMLNRSVFFIQNQNIKIFRFKIYVSLELAEKLPLDL